MPSLQEASRRPPYSSTGTVTGDSYDITTKRTTAGVNYQFEAKKARWFGGVERFSDTVTLDRSLDIDFSNISSGVGLHADGLTDLKKSGWRVGFGVTYQATSRLAFTTNTAFGKNTWRLDAGLQLDIR